MALLTDTDLLAALTAPGGARLIVGATDPAVQVRGCSVDLTIGEIFCPGKCGQELGAASHPRMRHSLREGATSVIRTSEEFRLDAQHAAFVFPASGVSLRGLLMTNPGHVDPGYRGPLHVTVINMARQPYLLNKGDRFLRAFIFSLETPSTTTPPTSGTGRINDELFEELAPDFMSVTDRTKKAIDHAEIRSRLSTAILTVLITVIGSFATVYITNNSLSREFSQRIDQIESLKIDNRLVKLESITLLEKRVAELERMLKERQEPQTSRRSPR